jgi:PAS domain S-box-containing protein
MSIRRDRHAPRTALAYGVAVAVVVAALLFRFSINFWLGPRVPYLQFFPAILVASWYGGFGPGVLAALLSALFAHIWFLQPIGLFKVPALADVHSLSLFVLAGCGIAYLSGAMKRAESAQRQTADQWRTTLASIGDGVIVTDTAGRVTFVNDVAARLTGWDMASAVNRPLREIFVIADEDGREALESPVAQVLRGGTMAGLANHTILRHRDGHWIPIAESGAPIRGTTTEVEGIVLVFRDRTAERASADALRRSQSMLQVISDNSPTVIYAKDLDGRYLFINKRYSELFHVSLEDMVGKTDHDLFEKEAADAFRAMDTRVAQAGVAITEEETAPHDDGLHTYISVKSPLLDERGTPYATFGLSTDITELKRSEVALRAQLERLDLLDRLTRAIGERQDLHSILQVVVRSLEDHLPLDFCCICLYDRADESLTVARVGVKSEAVARELALEEKARIAIDENGLSRCVRGQLIHEPDIAAEPFPFPQRLARGGLRSLVAAPLLVESQVFGVLMAARREQNGFSSAECEFLRQLSEHVALAAHQARLYTALQQAYDDLRQTQQAVMQQERLKALGQMASGIAHDINNAISPIALYTESLLEAEPHLTERGRSHLTTIQRAIEDVAQTVARMREFYRARESQLVLTPVDLNRVAQDATDLTRARWSDIPQQRGIVIKLILVPDSATPIVMAVESEIREALINLIFNAVDAMPDGGTLTIRTRSDQPSGSEPAASGQAHLDVIDTGSGMDAETRRRCLEPFFTTKGERGTGLGLAMVYGMVQRHGAEIEIDSAPRRGTRVRLTFTVLATDSDTHREEPIGYARPSRLRILVVDDDPLLLNSLRDTLEGDGHSVSVASGGRAGIDAFQAALDGRTPFDLVITDLGMPYVDGRQVASSIKQASPSTPIVLLTGWGQRLMDEGGTPSHVDRVLNKPPKLSELRPALAELTANRSA